MKLEFIPLWLGFLFVSLIGVANNGIYDKNEIANFLEEIQRASDLSNQDVSHPIVTDQYVSRHNRITHLYLRQSFNGIGVSNAVMNLAIDRRGQLVNYHNSFVVDLVTKVNTTVPQTEPLKAVEAMAQDLNLRIDEPLQIAQSVEGNALEMVLADNSIAADPIKISPIYYLTKEGDVRLAWDIALLTAQDLHWWNYQIDAVTGEILNKITWTINCQWDEHCSEEGHMHQHNEMDCEPHFAEKEMDSDLKAPVANGYRVYAYPVESPNHGSRTLEVDPWLAGDPSATLGWHNDGNQTYNYTRGNNVWAQEDRNGNNGTGASPNSATFTYDYPLNLNNDPSTYTDAATTNLFYWNNLIHDVFYQYGFDEASGNFQNDNMGRGGNGNDFVYADCQDGSGTNNANFSSPPDGSNGRMQMFEWTAGAMVNFQVNSPGGVAGSYNAIQAGFGPGLPINPASISGNLVIVDDGTANPSEGCNPLINAAAVNGNIAVIDRGNCTFVVKVKEAQNAGAIACVVCNNVAGGPITMSGTDASITIPSVMISQADCAAIRAAIPTVNVTMSSSGSSANIDGDFDNGIIAHEYGHGVSIRLTGGPGNSGCLSNEEQMGEGWSDWIGMWMTIEAGDASGDKRGVGTFAQNQPITGSGIRPAPYSSDFAINPYTYGDLCNAEVTVPHGVGFVWSTMLWDLTWAFIDQYGFDPDIYNGTGGNNIVAQLIMDGMKLQPCSPGFVDGRDAILQADQINNGGANECLIWQAFANRGLGASASQGASTSRCDGTEAFDLPASCNNILSISKIANQPTVQIGQNINFDIDVDNFTASSLSNVTIKDTLPIGLEYVNGSATCGVTTNGNILTFTPTSLVSSGSMLCSYDAKAVGPAYSVFSVLDNMDNGNTLWTTNNLYGNSYNWVNGTSNPNSGSNAWYAIDKDTITDFALTLTTAVPITGNNPQLRFFHEYDTESTWDGGVVEISSNGGANWTDLGQYMIQNGYNNVMQVNAASSISGRQAFTGQSLGYLETIVDLSSYVGLNVQVRFRMSCDEFVGGNGWYVDDVAIVDAVELINTACVTATGQENNCDEARFLVIGPNCEAVAEISELCDGQTATLDGSMSTSINGAISTYTWTTPDGNIVSGANTAMPVVDADGMYILTVSDGTCTAMDTVDVTIDPLLLNFKSKLVLSGNPNDIWGYTAPDGTEYALVGLVNGVSIVSIADPENPVEVHYISGVNIGWRDLKTWDSYAYIVNESASGGGLLIIDLSGLTTDPVTSSITTYNTDFGIGYTDSHNIFIDEFGKAYLFGATCSSNIPGTTTTAGTLIVDVASNPSNPTYIGAYPRYNIISGKDTYVHDGYARGDTLYTSHIYDGTFGVVDVSGIASLPNGVITANEVLALQPTPGDFTHACWVSDDGNILVAVDEVGGNTGLGINTYDISDLSNIVYLDNIESFPGTNVTPHNVFIKGDYIVASYYTSGL